MNLNKSEALKLLPRSFSTSRLSCAHVLQPAVGPILLVYRLRVAEVTPYSGAPERPTFMDAPRAVAYIKSSPSTIQSKLRISRWVAQVSVIGPASFEAGSSQVRLGVSFRSMAAPCTPAITERGHRSGAMMAFWNLKWCFRMAREA